MSPPFIYTTQEVIVAKVDQPVRVQVTSDKKAGTVLREKEGSGTCAQCGVTKSCLFSYDDEAKGFCNRGHWLIYILLGIGAGGSRYEDEAGKTPRGHVRRHKKTVNS